jgi:tetratricopeptide (TPR) repeat protein
MRTSLNRAIASLVLCAASHSISQANPNERDIRQATHWHVAGTRALKAGNFGKARELFSKAAAAFPAFPEAHVGLGHVAMAEARYEEALREYQQASEGYAALGTALMDIRVERYNEAQAEISRLRDAVMSRNAGASSTNATALAPEVLEAEETIQRLESIQQPTEEPGAVPSEIAFFIGNALFRLNRLDDAMRSWESCARSSRDFPLVWNNLAVAYMSQGRLEQARMALARAERLGFHPSPALKARLERPVRTIPPDGPTTMASAQAPSIEESSRR